jgi:hypothetical protein
MSLRRQGCAPSEENSREIGQCRTQLCPPYQWRGYSLFITAVIKVHEECNVACFNMLGAFLHANLDEDITMVLKESLAKLMVQVMPNLDRKYISANRRGMAILYVKMQKAIYGSSGVPCFFTRSFR